MGCKTSKFSEEHEHFHGLYSRPDTPSIYSTHTRTPPSHSRDNSLDYGSGGGRPPMLQSKFSDSFYTNKHNAPNNNNSRFFSRGHGGVGTNSSKDPEKMGPFCNHVRQGNNPCFACLREKPKPRRHKSRRNAQVMIPRASYYGKKKQRNHSRSSSIEAPLRPEEQAPWVTARHGVFVPPTVANELNASITQHEREEGHHFRSFRPSQDSGQTVVGGYIVSPEMYYSSLPLPDLPQDAYYDHTAEQRANGRGRLPAWI